MATGRKTRSGAGQPEQERVVRRSPGDRRRLSPELEAFARSDEKRLRSAAPRGPKLKDPRAVALVPGVSNRDARLVFDAHLERLEALVAAGEAEREALGASLAEAIMVGLWRGRALTAADAPALAREGAQSLALPLAHCRPELVASWFRAEAALLEESHEGRARIHAGPNGEPALVVAVGGARASDALHAVGRRMT